jgi:putative membrane-bound dehydrogenase-like protein
VRSPPCEPTFARLSAQILASEGGVARGCARAWGGFCDAIDYDDDLLPEANRDFYEGDAAVGRISIVALLACCCTIGELQAEPVNWSVGVAAVDITPDYPVRLNGFGFRRNESEGVRQPIYAKALAIGNGDEKPAVLITVDTLGIPDALVERLAKKLNQAAGIPRDHLSITASHTHTGPMVNDVSPTLFGMPIPEPHQAHIDQYSREFEEKLGQVALKALADRQPATLGWALGRVGFAKNRRTTGGPVDHDLPLLVVKGKDGKLRAVYVNYACHCVTLSDNRISGDWAGYAMAMIERQHPECTALLSIGCGADANPSSGVVGDRADIAEMQGVEIAQEVNRLLGGPLTPLTQPLATRQQRITLDFAELPAREVWNERAKQQNAVGFHARTMLEKLDRGEQLLTNVSYSIQIWTFGDQLATVFLPGEVVVDYSKRLKREFDGARLWINAYSNGCPGYVPSERVLKEGGYEGGGAMIYYALPGPYAAGLEDKIVATVGQQVPAAFRPKDDASKTQGSRPRSPAQTVTSFQLKPGFVAEVVAAEPLINSPVAIDFDQRGRLWVAEMYDYPSGVDNQFTPGGRIRVLTDTDGDGRYDDAKLFLEGIPFPTGVTVWRDGVLICAAPDILFARDTDGDNRADDVRRLFTGFATQNYQARVNSLEYGFDGWVYGACGIFGGDIQCLLPDKTVPLGQRDFRINPDRGLLEPAGGRTQQGRARDDWGNSFGCNNSSLALYFPIEERYLSRNPFVVPPATVLGIVAGPDGGRLFPVADLVRFKLSGPPGTATAACGLGIYRDHLLGDEYRDNLFVCEPVNNLVHRRVLKPNGASFEALRAADEPNIEFLASSDQWFRPVQARTGPDGALWVVDMYRYVIEHPTWIPPETLATLDVRAGANRGRIYRIARRESSPRPIEDLSKLGSKELVARLESPNGPVRDLAQQMVQWNRDVAAAASLKALVENGKSPQSRMQALHTLENLTAMDAATLKRSLRDADPRVRRHALRVAEAHFAEDGIGEAMLACEVDSLPLRIQLANTLGEWKDPRAAARLADLTLESADSPYLAAAVFSSLSSENLGSVTQKVLASPDASESMIAQLLEQTGSLADTNEVRKVVAVLAAEPSKPQTFFRLARMFNALSRRLRETPDLLDDASRQALSGVLAAARKHAAGSAPDAERKAAIELISRASDQLGEDARWLAGLLIPAQPAAIQQAVISVLSRFDGQDVPPLLIDAWPSLTPPLRAQVLETLLSRPAWSAALLESVQKQDVAANDLDLVSRQRLLENPDAALRAAAQSLLEAGAGSVVRQAVVDRYRKAVTADGNASLGRDVFRKRCTSCHRLEDHGNAVGPDLNIYAAKPTDALLIALFDPNQSVDPRYQNYAVVLSDGRVLNGMLAEETSTALTLVTPEGKQHSLLRVDIDALRNTGRSLMPEGFERDLSPSDVVNLIAYFRSLRAAPKQLPGNTPELVRSATGKAVRLAASQAEIYGNQITFEPPFGNIGYWHAETDYIRWQLELPAATEFDVWLDWACANGSEGNPYALQIGSTELKGTVAVTGGWDQYRQIKAGRVALPAGRTEVLLRPAGSVRGALFDLRALLLVPAGKQPDFEVRLPDAPPLPQDPVSIAQFLMSDNAPAEQRQALIDRHTDIADKLITVMTAGFAAGTPEEYRRIPSIWRVAITAGKRNRDQDLRALLTVSAPHPFEPLRDWQAVVIGGGLIDGVSQAGDWPGKRFGALLKDDPVLQKRWDRAIDLAFKMADDERVKTGTRYDALRMVAMAPWERSRPVLERYLAEGVNSELQMGAVSGLADVSDPAAAMLLIGALNSLPARNRELALDGLLKTDERIGLLLDAVESGRLDVRVLGKERLDSLGNHPNPAVRKRVSVLKPR